MGMVLNAFNVNGEEYAYYRYYYGYGHGTEYYSEKLHAGTTATDPDGND